jgi:hypothetical protein
MDWTHPAMKISPTYICNQDHVLSWRMSLFLLVYGLLESSSFKSQGHRHVFQMSFSNSIFKMKLFTLFFPYALKLAKKQKNKKQTLHGPYLVSLLDLTPISE